MILEMLKTLLQYGVEPITVVFIFFMFKKPIIGFLNEMRSVTVKIPNGSQISVEKNIDKLKLDSSKLSNNPDNAIERYKNESNSFLLFVKECVSFNVNEKYNRRDLMKCYIDWCNKNKYSAFSQHKVTKILSTDFNINSIRSGNVHFYVGLKIESDIDLVDIKNFRERYSDLEIKEFCHKFSTGTFYRSKWKYEWTGIDERYLGQLIQKLIDDEIIIPIDTTKRRDETDYEIKSSDKEKILRRIHSKIIKKEKEDKEEKRRNRKMESLKKEKEVKVFIHNEIDKIFMRTPIDYLKNFLKKIIWRCMDNPRF